MLDRIRYQPDFNLAYINNPKAACTTIKYSLMRGQVDDIHKYEFPPYTDPTVPLFTVVRNPYLRAISCYLSRFARGISPGWKSFCKRFSLDPSTPISFEQYLETIAAVQDKARLDAHFRPQHLNVCHAALRPEFVGHLENLQAVGAYLLAKGVALMARPGIPSGNRSRDLTRTMISPRCKSLIESFYQEDFALYGYDPDDLDGCPAEPIRQDQWLSPALFSCASGLE